MSQANSDPRVLVILPTYNERVGLPVIVAEIHQALPLAEILIIDDSSPDGTGKIADTLAENNRWVTVHHRVSKQGLGTAYLAGFAEALTSGVKYVVQMDSDGSHQATDLPQLLAAVQAGAGLAIGTRWMNGGSIHGWSLHRRMISRIGTWVARRSLRSQLRDLTSGFRAFDTHWLNKINLKTIESQGYSFQVEMAWRCERLGCPIAEVPIAFIERSAGRSKMSVGIVSEALRRVLCWGVRLRLRPSTLSAQSSTRHSSLPS